jgi:CheY-like chemotaxis protein
VNDDTPDPAATPVPAADLPVRAAIHDANQLLWVIQGQASLLLQEPRDPAVAATAERIIAAARDAAAVLRPLLGRVEILADPQEHDGDIVEILWSSWRRCLAGAAARGLATDNLHLDAPPLPGPRVLVPELVVSRLFANLLVNAIEAMTTGGRVTCRLGTAGDGITVTLQDDGPGLPAAVAAAPFAGRHGSGKPHGHGIGLAGCRQLARDHGGDLELVAAAAPGAVFRLRLPSGPRRLRVFAVDDEPTVREMLAEVLGTEGHEVRLACDDADARGAFVGGRYDVVLLDYRLPGRSGLELADDLRRVDRAVAIILMTGWGPAGERPADASAAVDFSAAKPLDMPALQALLSRAGALTASRRGARI